MTNWEIGGGQYWHVNYDPYDPFSFADSYVEVPGEFNNEIADGEMVPMLIVHGTIYPQGRMQAITIKGIDRNQKVLKLPTHTFDTLTDAIPAFIGEMTARSMKLAVGDRVTIRWRDVRGTFDAAEIVIAAVFSSNVPAAEAMQVYIPIEALQNMMQLGNVATIFTFADEHKDRAPFDGLVLKTKKELTKMVDDMIKTKSAGQSVFYFILLLLAMLAIFDTQVLSIFRRQKEIGTYIALGYTRKEVVGLFTGEGAMHSILAAVVSAVYGLPFLMWQAKVGWTMPVETSDFGMAIAQTLYPVYSVGLVVSTTLIVVLVTTVVSYWPSKKIAKMNPTEALRGKIQ
jgi:ABC-type lipoprotein release transport system permease subunit